MSIEYKTEAKVVISVKDQANSSGAPNPVVMSWQVGAEKVKLVQGANTVAELNASQLRQIAELAPQIIRDLGDQSRHPSAA